MLLLLSGISGGFGLIAKTNNHNILAAILFAFAALMFYADLKGFRFNFGGEE